MYNYKCESCYRTFAAQRACNQHMHDKNHWGPHYECETCTDVLRSQHACNQHMDALDHWAYNFECETCGLAFRTEDDFEDHMAAECHWRNYCRDCDRYFQNENNMRMHLRSRTHNANSVTCPFCRTLFTTASGVASHLESFGCSAARNFSRATIYEKIRRRDRRDAITEKLLTWHGNSNSSDDDWHPSNAWNGYAYECYVCHKGFGSPRALQQHIDSPTHQQPLYHCPNRKCGRLYPSFAALLNHLESESCGYVRFETVQRSVSQFVTGKGPLPISSSRRLVTY